MKGIKAYNSKKKKKFAEIPMEEFLLKDFFFLLRSEGRIQSMSNY